MLPLQAAQGIHSTPVTNGRLSENHSWASYITHLTAILDLSVIPAIDNPLFSTGSSLVPPWPSLNLRHLHLLSLQQPSARVHGQPCPKHLPRSHPSLLILLSTGMERDSAFLCSCPFQVIEKLISMPFWLLMVFSGIGYHSLHVYMIDYCRKRGFRASVEALSNETKIPHDEPVPTDAPQGLLFEFVWNISAIQSLSN